MKYLIRVFMFHCFSLWFVSQILPALAITGGWQVLLFAGFILSLLMLLVAPILKILFIPINMITFGLLSWFIDVIVIYLLTVSVSDVSVRAWTFPGASAGGFIIPSIQFSYIISLILVSLAVSFFVNLLHDISEH